jgi:phosphatidylethanolamine-binding protein (PEBP) family uncharacterized protein
VSEVEVVTLNNFVIVALMLFIGLGSTTQAQPLPQAPAPSTPGLALTTAAFQDGGIVPNKYTRAAEGDAVSPKLTWTNVPGMAANVAGPYHHYTFELFALDTKLKLGPDATQADLLKGMNGYAKN